MSGYPPLASRAGRLLVAHSGGRERNEAARTVAIDTESVRYLAVFLDDRGMPTDVANVTREHIEACLAHVLAKREAATASIRDRSLRRFFEWCREEGEVVESPTRNIHGPAI